MDNESLDPIEQQLRLVTPKALPSGLRVLTLLAVHKRLMTQRWERRIGRLTAAVLVLGIVLNWTVGWHDHGALFGREVATSAADSRAIVEVAVAIGKETDAETGRRMAEQLTVLSGAANSPEQAAAIEQEIQRRLKSGKLVRKEG
ncbi:MAG TPA: hypothetical protein VFE46_07735 [Pirellulales bacterium]|jgi:hypothetical protein|nr:hypothetical protein [Pirellulales bacterium]